ncbi:MAG: D-xylose transporter subunit XylF, partial [Verrucomicrobiota bacterium]|nr:D-xylose transporter subunit XylF [Verrucomicrobiota bacterium]
TVYKPIKNLARRAAELAVDLAGKKPIKTTDHLNNGRLDVPCVFLPIVTVDKNNLRETVIADGFHTAEEVFGRP